MSTVLQDKEYLKNLTVLYVEDDEATREISSQYLSRCVGTLITASNGAEGLAAYRSRTPDIIITDIQMPQMDGLEMARIIREQDRSVSIIVLTAFDQGDYLMKSINIGIDHYVTKPVVGRQLQDALSGCAHRLLLEHRLQQTQASLASEHQRLQLILDGAVEGFWDWDLQRDRVFLSPRYCEIIAYSPEETVFDSSFLRKIIHPDDFARVFQLVREIFRGERERFLTEYRMLTRGGTHCWVENKGRVVEYDGQGRPARMVGSIVDISDRKRFENKLLFNEERLRILNERFELASSAAGIGLWEHDLADGGITWDTQMFALFGREHDCPEQPPAIITNCVHPADADRLGDEYRQTVEDDFEFDTEFRVIWPDGGIRHIKANAAVIRADSGTPLRMIGTCYDISDLKEALERLEYMAHHDKLTNLPNRTLFFDLVAQHLALARRNRSRLALMFIDLDRFKQINDNHGHAVGDLVLQESARRMEACLRASDCIGRIGGDEFVVLLLDIGSIESANLVAEKICASLRRPFAVAGLSAEISSSIGVAIYPDHGDDAVTLTRKADTAMYHAKQAGRDNVTLFSAEMLKEDAP